jgi:hypothetical protein
MDKPAMFLQQRTESNHPFTNNKLNKLKLIQIFKKKSEIEQNKSYCTKENHVNPTNNS